MTERDIKVELSPNLPEQLLDLEIGRSVQLLGNLSVGNTGITISTESIAIYRDHFNRNDQSLSLQIFSELTALIPEGYMRLISEQLSDIIVQDEEYSLDVINNNRFFMNIIKDSKYDNPKTIVFPAKSGKTWHIQTLLENFKFGADTDREAVENSLEHHSLTISALSEVILSMKRPKNYENINTVFIGMPPKTERVNQQPNNEIEYISDGFDSYAGIDKVVQELREMVTLAKMEPHDLQNLGVERTQAVLLYGPSGVGKTELMKTLTLEIGLNVIDIDYSDISDIYIGEWAKNIDNIFISAFDSNEKVAIVIDEFEGVIQTGNQGVNNNINAVLKRRLEQLPQHPNVFVFMATNEIDSIDPVVRADKRIPLKIPISLPSQEDRYEIFKKLLVDNRIRSVDKDDIDNAMKIFMSQESYDFKKLAETTDNFSGGDISQVIKEVNKSRLIESLNNNDDEMPPITMELLELAINRAKKTKS